MGNVARRVISNQAPHAAAPPLQPANPAATNPACSSTLSQHRHNSNTGVASSHHQNAAGAPGSGRRAPRAASSHSYSYAGGGGGATAAEPAFYPVPGRPYSIHELNEDQQIQIAKRMDFIQCLPHEFYQKSSRKQLATTVNQVANQRRESFDEQGEEAHEHTQTHSLAAANEEKHKTTCSISSTTTASSQEDDECIICMHEYAQGDKVRHLPCMHMFHQACIDDWLMRSFQCPICMRPFDDLLLLQNSLTAPPSHSQPANQYDVTTPAGAAALASANEMTTGGFLQLLSASAPPPSSSLQQQHSTSSSSSRVSPTCSTSSTATKTASASQQTSQSHKSAAPIKSSSNITGNPVEANASTAANSTNQIGVLPRNYDQNQQQKQQQPIPQRQKQLRQKAVAAAASPFNSASSPANQMLSAYTPSIIVKSPHGNDTEPGGLSEAGASSSSSAVSIDYKKY